MMNRGRAIQALFVLWIVIAAFPISIITIQSVADYYSVDNSVAWTWLLMQISPVFALLLAAVFADPSHEWRTGLAHSFKWKCALWTSVGQGVMILAVLLSAPVLSIDPYALFERTGVGLAIWQSFVVAAVGAVIFDGR